MNIFHLLLCIYCLVAENPVTANVKECSSRSETEAGGYFKLEGENGNFSCIKRITVNKGFRVRMFLMSSKNTFGIDVVESSEGTKYPGQAFNHNLEMFESNYNEIEVRIDPKSAPLDVQWWRVCGGTLDRNSGKLIGPDHVSGYPENQTCTWNITVLNGYMLSLTLNVDGYNDGTNCSLDHIQVVEVQSEETISRGLICSGKLTLKSNKSMRIVFHSDNDSTTGLSFNASWVSKCGESFSSDTGELSSPDNPVDFESAVRCNWTISVSPGHTIVINYTLPKTSKDEAACKSYVQVTEAESDASKILCTSSNFADHKSSSNTLRISFTYEPGMNYSRFYAKWHSVDAQRHDEKVVTTEVGQGQGSNGPTKTEGSSGSTTASLVEKDRKVNKTSLSVADVILQTAAAPMTLVIFIIILLLVRRAKSMRCFLKEQTAHDIEENMYDSLSEINVEVDNSKLEIRKDIHLLRKKSITTQTFRRRLPSIPTGRLSAILAQVGQRIQFGNDRYDTAYDEPAERRPTEFHESKQEDAHSEQDKLSIINKSTRESFINAGYISGDNADQVKRRSVCSISVTNDCVMNESTVEAMNNDGYLTPVDFNSSLTEISISTLSITIESTKESFINAGYISGDNIDEVKRRSVCSINCAENDCVMNESAVETIDNDGYLTPVDFNSSLTEINTSIADSDSMKLNVDIHHEEDKQLYTSLCIGQDSASYTGMGDFVEAHNTSVWIRLDDGAEGKDLCGGKDETDGKHSAIKETRTEESTDSYLTLPAYPES